MMRKTADRIGAWNRAMWTALAVGLVLLTGVPAQAQQRYSPAIKVGGEVITVYQVTEALEMREAREAGIEVSEEALREAMDTFAAQGNLDAEQFTALLAKAGVAAGTFRDFIHAQTAWREFIKKRFRARAAISEAEIDAAIADHKPEPGLRVLLSEIVLPAGDAATRRASRARAQKLTGLDEAGFADAAMRFSIGASRNNGGKMNWLDITKVPAGIAPAVRGLRPGQTSRIIETEDDLRLYFMRDREEVTGRTRVMVDYAALLLPGGTAQDGAEIRAKVVGCDDLYPIARALPPEQLIRETVAETAVPAPWRAELATLDPGEISSRLTAEGGTMVVLMLCSRGNEAPRSLTRESVKNALLSRRMSTMATMHLEALKGNVTIERFAY